jgi:hypothetical protein
MKSKRPPSKTRVVGYHFDGARFPIEVVHRHLQHARAVGIVTEFHAKRYTDEDVVWFNGPPGQALRAVRDAIGRLRQ